MKNEVELTVVIQKDDPLKTLAKSEVPDEEAEE